ncbi:MAG: bifunctional DNA primase/polymerase, partial [Deltaproteobacteria bacterium]|nr:bifunctional DNA primase/polymerase [Deltaproteobacteria bacterium]
MSDRNFKKQIKKFKKLSKRFCSLIPLHGKRPFENGWQQYCVEKRLFRKKDFKECNAGLTTGPANGIIVYDVDDISKAKEKRKKEGWELPKTLVVRTGSG